MKNIIDLHGVSHKEAAKKVENELILSSLNDNFEFEIITGNSSTMQKIIIDKVLKPFNFNYYISSNNLGSILVSNTTL
mgnify:FL=1